ncbi:alpha/beta hydrolase [Agaribacter marinus]|uniref:Esterase n=1 Tax=Agaribacter marinus TaxID=1431249 RepID=A0AA37T572_9ALTE|nr:alpha/beta hydrolase-fold protein [Agaribacter marinus]GLR71620.1 hypothetical protein GCM10007852_25280 [Agaribacter marinus]
MMYFLQKINLINRSRIHLRHFISTIALTLLLASNTAFAADDKKPWVWHEHIKGVYDGPKSLVSAITGIEYPYHVYLPPSYNEQPNAVYPVFIILDGQWNLPGYGFNVDQKKLDIILVAIEEGPKGSKRRNIDYKLPGAIAYTDFIAKEFVPHIDSHYRVDSANRTIQGTSLGGIASTVMLLRDDVKQPLFKNYLADDPSYWDRADEMQALAKLRKDAGVTKQANLFVTTAFPLGNHYAATELLDTIESLDIPHLNITREKYFTTHKNISSASLKDTLDKVFGSLKQ